jgi:hypothetical protein
MKSQKLDLIKTHKTYFKAKATPVLVHLETARYISIRGKGDPSGKAFSDRIEALYSTAYTLKFAFKAKDKDFAVSKLEGLWWFDEEKHAGKTPETAATEVPRSEWEYRLLIMLPDYITKKELNQSMEAVVARKNLPLARQIEYYTIPGGDSVQILHTGPFATEPESLRQIMTFMKTHKLIKNGPHHEIYLSDFRKTKPDKLKTILREPVMCFQNQKTST